MTIRARQLATKANDRLALLGAAPPVGSFVCPMCLRLVPLGEATEGHFPARSVRARRRRTEVQCVACNSGIGGSYERAGVDYMEFIRTVTMTKPDGSGSVRRRARVRNKEGGVSVELISAKSGKRRMPEGRTRDRLDRIMEGPAEHRAMAVSIARPNDEGAKRAMMAWSFLELFRYAGYRYAASPGAELARRLILDPRAPLPAGCFYTKGSITLPLAAPEPVIVARRESPDVEEVVAFGVQWDGMVAAFPFAGDEDDRVWSRLAELMALDQLISTQAVALRAVGGFLAGVLDDPIVIRDDSGTPRSITVDLAAAEVADLAAGRSRRRLDPPRGRGWLPAMTVEHEFVITEGKPPRPPADRVAYWRSRFIAKGGGFLPQMVGELFEEIPGVPRPIPERFPLRMEQTRRGWAASIAMSPLGVGGTGSSPADAVAALLANAERDFAEDLRPVEDPPQKPAR